MQYNFDPDPDTEEISKLCKSLIGMEIELSFVSTPLHPWKLKMNVFNL